MGIDEAWLREKYLVKKFSASKIAEECNCSVPTVITYLKKYGIKNRGWSEAKIAQFSHDTSKAYRDPNWLFDQYVNHKRSSGDIAKLCGCGRTTIRTYLNRFNVPIRSQEEISNSKEFKEKIGRITKERWDTPGGRETFIVALNTDETRAKLSANARHLWDTPELRAKVEDHWHEVVANPLYRKQNAAMNSLRTGPLSPRWKGGKSFEPYCPKFNREFKKRVRAFFEHRCVCCGKHENECRRKLSVHHIEYNKQACCDNRIAQFVTLCDMHHSKTNGDRDRWESMLHRIIDEIYDGKSYYTKEEWRNVNETSYE
jgi:transposase